MNEHINENHLKQFFEAKFKIPVVSVQMSNDKPAITFGGELLERGFLKSMFKLGMRNRVSRYKRLQEEEYAET